MDHLLNRRHILGLTAASLGGCLGRSEGPENLPPTKSDTKTEAPPTTIPDQSYYEWIRRWLTDNETPPEGFLFGDDEQTVFKQFNTYGPSISATTTRSVNAPTKGPFTTAQELVISEAPTNHWGVIYGITDQRTRSIASETPVLVVFYARGTAADAGSAQIRLIVKKDEERAIFRENIYLGPDWHRYVIPISMDEAISGDDDLKLEFFCGFGKQTVAIGGVACCVFPSSTAIEDLPTSTIEYGYEGQADDAPWRDDARDRIETHRKAPLSVTVTDTNDQSIEGAELEITMQSHAFGWGNLSQTALTTGGSPDGDRYKETLLEYFNELTIGTMKWTAWRGAWSDAHDADNTRAIFEWATEHDLPVHGHTLCWHQFGHMPFDPETDSIDAIRSDILEWVESMVGDDQFRGVIDDWDLINHPVAFSEVWEHVGKDIMLEELATARAADPEADLFVNEGGIMTLGAGRLGAFEDIITYYMDNEAPLDGLGFMCHFGSKSLTGIPDLLERFDRFSSLDEGTAYDLDLQVTEFDIAIDRDDPDQVTLQRDYYHDFLVAVFSHPAVSTIAQWGMWPGDMWKPSGAIFDMDWNLRPHGEVFRELVFDRWWSEKSLVTDSDGTATASIFKGTHELTVRADGKETETTVSVTEETAIEVTIE